MTSIFPCRDELNVILVDILSNKINKIIEDCYKNLLKYYDIKIIIFSLEDSDIINRNVKYPFLLNIKNINNEDLKEMLTKHTLILHGNDTIQYNDALEIKMKDGEERYFKIKSQYIPNSLEFKPNLYIKYNTDTEQINTIYERIKSTSMDVLIEEFGVNYENLMDFLKFIVPTLTVIIIAADPNICNEIMEECYAKFLDKYNIQFEFYSDLDPKVYNDIKYPFTLHSRFFNEEDLKKSSENPLVFIIDSAGTFEYSDDATMVGFNKYYDYENLKPKYGDATYKKFKVKTQYIPMWSDYKPNFYFHFNETLGEIETLFMRIYNLKNLEDLLFNNTSFIDNFELMDSILLHPSVRLGINAKNTPDVIRLISIDEVSRLRPDLTENGKLVGDPLTMLNGFIAAYKRKYYQKYLKYKNKYLRLKN